MRGIRDLGRCDWAVSEHDQSAWSVLLVPGPPDMLIPLSYRFLEAGKISAEQPGLKRWPLIAQGVDFRSNRLLDAVPVLASPTEATDRAPTSPRLLPADVVGDQTKQVLEAVEGSFVLLLVRLQLGQPRAQHLNQTIAHRRVAPLEAGQLLRDAVFDRGRSAQAERRRLPIVAITDRRWGQQLGEEGLSATDDSSESCGIEHEHGRVDAEVEPRARSATPVERVRKARDRHRNEAVVGGLAPVGGHDSDAPQILDELLVRADALGEFLFGIGRPRREVVSAHPFDDTAHLGGYQFVDRWPLCRIADQLTNLRDQLDIHALNRSRDRAWETSRVKIFISSVRRGLEEERGALPGLIQALGHEPRRFEDYGAQAVPSRQACLDGVEDADAYILLLGEQYGTALPDTGKSPTEEEFTVAKRRGIPIWVFRKRDVEMEPAQEEFAGRIEAYSTGVFRKGFSNATGLLPEVARAIRELEQAPAALQFTPLPTPSDVLWNSFERHGWRSTATTLELIAVPLDAAPPTATALSALPARLARVGREHGLFDESHALDAGIEHSAAHAATRPDRNVPIAGLGVTASGAVSIWHEMPSDMLGVILDESELARRITEMIRVVAEVVPSTQSVALAIGLHHLGSVVEGNISDLGHRNSASMPGFGQDKSALVPPRDSVPAAALVRGASEIGRELAARQVLAFRDAFRH